ncbi:glycosyltransferase family 4 protein [Sphingobacteriaceae bacterium WQ 2009]|uniref:Glycosyltransferase family 4 protein n=1 Tax=Rhinopithecimicrobium faecis TaxID=2820698 RepID=A0A8T4H7S6_9SPHI|nr:glycosyltransferase family 4 protein [Sphingobacteriaceae bacterium WQ 2009]
MKIVYCINGTYNSGGMERVLANKVNFLTNFGYDVTIITCDQRGLNHFFKINENVKHIDLGINYVTTVDKNIITKSAAYFYKQAIHKQRLASELIKLKADVVVSMYDNDAAFLYKINDGSKKILEIHFSRFKRLQYNRTGILGYIDKYRSKLDFDLVQKYAKFIVLTKEDKSYWGDLTNIEVIPNSNSFETDKITNPHQKQVIAVGRYDYQKGFEDLINSWKAVHKLHPTWKLAIFGNGPLKDNLQLLIDQLALSSVVELCPSVKNIEEEYLKSSILAMTSKYEGLPMVLLEAQVCGLALVSYTCKCGPKDIITDGVNGKLVSEGNIQEFSDKLITLIENEQLRTQMGIAAKENSKNYKEELVMHRWVNLFQQIISKN